MWLHFVSLRRACAFALVPRSFAGAPGGVATCSGGANQKTKFANQKTKIANQKNVFFFRNFVIKIGFVHIADGAKTI